MRTPECHDELMDVLYSEEHPLIRKPTDPIWITGIDRWV